eukprot:4097305-Pleurochrysis_carterae.AAC.2
MYQSALRQLTSHVHNLQTNNYRDLSVTLPSPLGTLDQICQFLQILARVSPVDLAIRGHPGGVMGYSPRSLKRRAPSAPSGSENEHSRPSFTQILQSKLD